MKTFAFLAVFFLTGCGFTGRAWRPVKGDTFGQILKKVGDRPTVAEVSRERTVAVWYELGEPFIIVHFEPGGRFNEDSVAIKNADVRFHVFEKMVSKP